MIALPILAALSAFMLVEQKDAMTDKMVITLGAEDGRSRLGLSCEQGKRIQARIVFERALDGPILGGSGIVRFQSRVDSLPTEDMVWEFDQDVPRELRTSSSFQIAGLLDMIQSGGQVFRLRADARSGPPMDLAFDISGAKPIVEKLLESCDSANVQKEIAQRHR